MTARASTFAWLGFAVAVAAAAGCERREQAKPPPPAEAAVSTPASTSSAAQDAPRELAFGDGRVQFFVPDGMKSSAKPAFVLVLHGLGGSGTELSQALGLEAFAREKQFVFAAPDGTLDAQGRRFWNANEVCCNFSHAEVDDVRRLMALVDHAIGALHADAKRVFVVGYSNGGFMAHRLACEHSARVRAIVSMAAAGPGPSERCQPTGPVSVLEIHGDADPIVPFDGGHLFGREELPRTPSVPSGLEVWARQAQCRGRLDQFQRLDLIPMLAGSETEGFHYSDCNTPSPLLWKVKAAGHVIPLGAPALDAIWNFLAAQG
jgi:polyhydroxybutyrate depolymerase